MRLFLPIIFSFMLFLLSACADTEWPQWISGEPTKEEMDGYKGPIKMPKQEVSGKEWPNLADVPSRPKIILQDAQKELLVTEMKDNNIQGLQVIDDYNKGLKPLVTPVPPKTVPKVIKTKKHKKKAKRHAK